MNYDLQDLNIIIEFSIGLAGFSAIVSVFLQRGEGLTVLQRFRILNLLNYAISPAFAAFICLSATHFTLNIDTALRFSAILFGVWITLTSVRIGMTAMALPEPDSQLMNAPLLYFSGILCVAIVLLQTIIVLNIAPGRNFALFYAGLVTCLLIAVIQFSRIVVSRGTTDQKIQR